MRDREHDLVVHLHPLVRGDERDDLMAFGLCVDQHLVAEVLDDLDLGLDVRGSRSGVAVQLQVLRTETDQYVLAPEPFGGSRGRSG